MTATDELRSMLEERGVEWKEEGHNKTKWSHDGIEYVAYNAWPRNGGATRLILHANITPEQAIAATLGTPVTGETSDGYHTFNELYNHRAVLFSVIVRDHRELAWKSKAHHDGTMYDGMFIVGIETPSGQATYHYDIDPYWDMFDCKELDRAPEWDGHTPDDAIERIATLGEGTCKVESSVGIEFNTLISPDYFEFEMSCGSRFSWSDNEPPDYCPGCGRKVVNGGS